MPFTWDEIGKEYQSRVNQFINKDLGKDGLRKWDEEDKIKNDEKKEKLKLNG